MNITIPTEVTEPFNKWRWRSENFIDEQLVNDETHIVSLIQLMTDENPWLILERGEGDTLTFVQLLFTSQGFVVEVNQPVKWVSRVTHKGTDVTDSLPGYAYTDEELFTLDEATEITFSWMTERLIPAAYRLCELIPTGTPLVRKVKKKR